ncbi:hypothetical protein HAX54_047660, partial [Datura stramonium]|nr:hypothetical protein [Datura stramonium]
PLDIISLVKISKLIMVDETGMTHIVRTLEEKNVAVIGEGDMLGGKLRGEPIVGPGSPIGLNIDADIVYFCKGSEIMDLGDELVVAEQSILTEIANDLVYIDEVVEDTVMLTDDEADTKRRSNS